MTTIGQGNKISQRAPPKWPNGEHHVPGRLTALPAVQVDRAQTFIRGYDRQFSVASQYCGSAEGQL